MKLNDRPAAKIKLIGGRLCLDFANTVGGRVASSTAKKGVEAYELRDDKLADYYDLLAWSMRVGLLADEAATRLARDAKLRGSEASEVWERAIALREVVYRISLAVMSETQPRAKDIELLNRELAVARGRMILARDEEGNFFWKWNETKDSLDQMLWRVADSAAEMLTASDLTRLRRCHGENCGWLFEDTSRNRSRQWCDMQDCGNIAKVRRFRSRMRNN